MIVLNEKLINSPPKFNKEDVQYDQDNDDNGFGNDGSESEDYQ